LQRDNADIRSVFSKFCVGQCYNNNEVNPPETGTLWYLPIRQTNEVPDGIEQPTRREVGMVDIEDRVARAANFISALLQATIDVGTTESTDGGVSSEGEIP
jgi:hypothetical protein